MYLNKHLKNQCQKNMRLLLFIFLIVYNFNLLAQPTKDNLTIEFEYVIINGDTTHFKEEIKLVFKDKNELKILRKKGGLSLIQFKESEIKYDYSYHLNKNQIIIAFDLNFWIEINNERERLIQLYYPIYNKKPQKTKEIIDMKLKQTTRELISYNYPESSINEAKVKFDFYWE